MLLCKSYHKYCKVCQMVTVTYDSQFPGFICRHGGIELATTFRPILDVEVPKYTRWIFACHLCVK